MNNKRLDIIICSLQRHPYFAAVVCCLFMILISNTAMAASDSYVEACSSKKINKEYIDAGCWSCDVVKMLLLSLTSVSQTFYGTTTALANVILLYGSVIWMAVFLLKALSSFAAQDPARILDGALTFLFKVALVYAMITAGIDQIVEYIVNPLLSIGMDIGSVYAKGTDIGGWTY